MAKACAVLLLVPLLVGLVLLPGCGEGQGRPEANRRSGKQAHPTTADLDGLKKVGQLRILIHGSEAGYLPREGSLPDRDRKLAADFAKAAGLKPVVVYVGEFDDLIPALLAGRGDVIAANLTVTKSRRKQIAFTVPLDHSREQIVSRATEKKVNKLSDLKGRTVVVQKGTSFWNTASDLLAHCPSLHVEALPGQLTSDEIFDKVAAGEIDLTIEDSNVIDVARQYRSDIRAVLDVTAERPLAWGVRPANPDLLNALNMFLREEGLTRKQDAIHKDDLPGIEKRQVLRLLTRNNSADYFLWKGRLMGFEYEFMRKFAETLGLRLEVIVPGEGEGLIPMLVAGRGDIAADFLTPTESRRAEGVEFSMPYHYAPDVVVARANDDKVKTPEDLKGRTVVVRRTSSYWGTLRQLIERGIGLRLEAAPQLMETEEIIGKVADGTYDLTVADGELLDIELAWRDDVKKAFALTEPQPQAWAVRRENRELLKAANAFIKKEYRGVFYNLTKRKYFKDRRTIRAYRQKHLGRDTTGHISPYDDLVRKYAKEYGFDWRLILAQMYQESRFNPRVKSSIGAEGLMQVMPRTAAELGFKDLANPAAGIHAGVKYLATLRGQFAPDLEASVRMRFSLASYNAGLGHVEDARRLARQIGRAPDRWFDHVEKAMLLLAKPQYAQKARYGYVRGREPVRYVRQIWDRYKAYARLLKE
ncbi:MAG: transporter substrate-binding domain-containing protein [Planctomycetes bacterium]|nr:transporter substrate-binding domain-containing protein [Planctomycetota bacterium]